MKNKFTLIVISYFTLGITVCFGQTKQYFNVAGTDYVRETFTSSVSNWPVPPGVSSVTYLVVGGGGGGGGAYDSAGAGGGGGGQVKSGTFTFSGQTTLNVVVGSGGSAGTANRPTENNGGAGSNSSFGTVIANGGTGGIRSRGGGASAGGTLNTGGSGGGGGFGGGGGGGNSSSGSNGRTPGNLDGGTGGTGTSNSLSGSSVVYSQGGDGGTAVIVVGPGNNGSTPAANRGHGGPGAGSAGSTDMNGRAGSDGIVIIVYEDNVVLPVGFKLFTATASANVINLHWETTSESNNSHYIIKRSTDGINFENMAKVEGKGNSNEISTYNLADKTPKIGTNYYQLIQVDDNGKMTTLSTESTVFGVGKVANSSAHPNPFTNSVSTSFEKGIFNRAILSDISGKVLASIAIEKEAVNCTFKTEKYPSGIYFIKLSGKQAATHKVIKR